ncbi:MULTISPECIES: hypothetical protein [unclassified Paenibacillus]|uniref:hypothetical protein n=1 Tax=unclassified Paenibacillus TaxID=185978 RepID=UPI001AE76B1D|nr:MULTISPECIES: hypothetical protein [unclassified Paenibacillus]MBP1155238.1 branched-subunit amino acid transport protein [Paenibacillus sp. PvP091]MBP1169378.1 branched-subunit amino acid transport protein [Paenibacillus sp. PvR098]MBP2440406.1 branched-subunit amino acid transport protein [Paenibacillus sp. PvP052]
MEPNARTEAENRYEDLFLRFTNRVEKAIGFVLLVLLLALVLSQLLLQHPQIRYLMVKVERLEGNPYSAALTPVMKENED